MCVSILSLARGRRYARQTMSSFVSLLAMNSIPIIANYKNVACIFGTVSLKPEGVS